MIDPSNDFRNTQFSRLEGNWVLSFGGIIGSLW